MFKNLTVRFARLKRFQPFGWESMGRTCETPKRNLPHLKYGLLSVSKRYGTMPSAKCGLNHHDFEEFQGRDGVKQ